MDDELLVIFFQLLFCGSQGYWFMLFFVDVLISH